MHTFEKRKALAAKIQQAHPGRIPIIVEKAKGSTLPDIDRKKFLAPADYTVAKFKTEVVSHTPLNSNDTLCLFVGASYEMPTHSDLISHVYDRHKNEDGFLYIWYDKENVFGNL